LDLLLFFPFFYSSYFKFSPSFALCFIVPENMSPVK
jgi:hypothetical protein